MRVVRETSITPSGLRPGRHLASHRHSQLQPALTATMAAAALCAVTRQVARGRLGQLDQAVMTRLLVMRRPAAALTTALTISAMAEPMSVAAMLAASGVAGRADRRTKALACLTVSSGAAARYLVALAVARPRPPKAGWQVRPSGFSLPSRHTTMSLLAAAACLRCAGKSGPAAWLLPPAVAAAVGASRVYLGVHWPADILAAGLFAAGWTAAADAVLRPVSSPR